MASPTGLCGTTWDCETRPFPYGIVPRRLIPPRHGTVPGRSRAVRSTSAEVGLSAASPKLREIAVPGCHCRAAPLGSCTSAPRTWGWSGPSFALGRTQNLLPTHVGMDQLPARLGEFSQHLPHACGESPSRGCERPGAHVSSGKGSAVSAAPPFFCVSRRSELPLTPLNPTGRRARD